jgi:hypothetical protein
MMYQKELSEKALEMRRLMQPAEAAEYLGGLVTGTLAKWRHYGMGPAYIKVGKRVLYARDDLDKFIDDRRRTSTSEAAA